jgi:hypothetical protein
MLYREKSGNPGYRPELKKRVAAANRQVAARGNALRLSWIDLDGAAIYVLFFALQIRS